MYKFIEIDKDTKKVLQVRVQSDKDNVLPMRDNAYIEEVSADLELDLINFDYIVDESLNITQQDPSQEKQTYQQAKTLEEEATALVSSVSSIEVSTWAKQETEARGWLNDNTYPTPLLDGILVSRTKYTKQTLAEKIITKADAYASAIGTQLGLKQSYDDEMKG